MSPKDECVCGHRGASHFESVDDGAGCVVCRDCDHFENAERAE